MKRLFFALAMTIAVLGAPILVSAVTAPRADASMMSSWYKAIARLRSETEFKGKAVYRDRPKDGTIEQRLRFKIQHAQPNSTYDVVFNGEVLGQIVTNGLGRGKLKFRTAQFNDDPDVLDMPPGFPRVVDGDTVTIGTLNGEFRVK